MHLQELGWNDSFAASFNEQTSLGNLKDTLPLRITRENREQYIALGEQGEFQCGVTGRFRFTHDSLSSYPAVGDWVVATPSAPGEAVIHAVLERRSSFSRKVPGMVTEEQVLAANIDTLFIVTGLDGNFNVRRIERYTTIAWESGAVPVLLLNKADLCDDVALRLAEVEEAAPGADVIISSAVTGNGIPEIRNFISPGKTVAFVGSSGVGKSTVINSLSGDSHLAVGSVSDANSKGRHTTTHRELILLPNGGMVIDTPGMRELQVWGDDQGLSQVFDDIETLATECRFNDCRHQSEPGCAVRRALEEGTLTHERYASYQKLKKEFAHLARKQSVRAMQEERAKWKEIARFGKEIQKVKHGKRGQW